jgi:glycosyltransferase involved in cell wall biosynthesis
MFSTVKLFFLKITALFKLILFFFKELNKIQKAEVIFFFPYYHTGGAEKVHLDIVKALNDPNNFVFFSDKSETKHYKDKFNLYANTYEIFEFLNRNFFIKKMFINILASSINKSYKLKSIFGCNSMFYYELLPFLKTSVKKIDLIHAFSKPDYGLEIFSLPSVPFLSNRIVINKKTLNDFQELYIQNSFLNYFNRIVKIENGINYNNVEFKAKENDTFSILYVGRWSKEKRPELFIEIAKKIKKLHPDIIFKMAGTNLDLYNDTIVETQIINLGEINNENELNNVYQNSNLILITSYREGFPVVIMEAMSNGVIPISTNVGGIGEHITDSFNGYLIENEIDTEKIISNFVEKIIILYENKAIFNSVSKNAIKYSKENFRIDNFNKNYKKVLLNKIV